MTQKGRKFYIFRAGLGAGSVDLCSMNSNPSSSARESSSLDLQRIYDQAWFKLYLPPELGGKDWSLPQGLDLLYRLAREDGNLAWVVNLGSGANYFYPLLSPAMARQVYAPEQAVVAGNGTATGTLQPAGQGLYKLQGSWQWCTGADWASAFTVMAHLLDSQGRETGEQIALVLFPGEVKIHRKWNAMGLRHSASYTIEVQHLKVPEERLFSLNSTWDGKDLPFHRLPFLTMARLKFSACVLGMAVHFCDLGRTFLEEKARQRGQRLAAPFHQWEQSQQKLDRTRESFFQLVESIWSLHLKSSSLPAESCKLVDEHCFSLAEDALSSADALFPWLGMAAVDATQTLNQVWMDLHTGGQHGLLRRL